MINPRVDDPLDFLYLDLATGIFVAHPKATTREQIMADYTLELLKLNDRAGLRRARENAYEFFSSSLERYIRAKTAKTFQKLDKCMAKSRPWIHSFEQEQSKTCLSIQKDILTAIHQTVWKEMQRQVAYDRKLKKLFQQAPEALTW